MSTSTCSRTPRVAVVFVAALLKASHAHAQAENEAAARTLFQEARAQMKAGDFAHACPKLEAAKQLYPGSGVLLNLGDCYAHTGRTASAWTIFGEALSAAQRTQRQSDIVEATARAKELEPKLTRILVEVERPVPGIEVRRDAMPLPAAAWAVAVPVDPGSHVIRAAAAGYKSVEIPIDASAPGQTVVVKVPALVLDAGAQTSTSAPSSPAGDSPSSSSSSSSSSGTGSGRRTAGLVLGGAGVIALGTSVALGFVAKGQYDKATGESGTARHDDSVSAVGLGNVATLVAIGGGVLAAAGAIVFFTAPKSNVTVGTNGTAVSVQGTF